MTKKKKVTIVSLLVVLFLIIATVLTLMIVANSQNDGTEPTKELSQWMGMIKDDTLLKSVVIPGAHDAGTKGIAYLAETQDRDVADLLRCGTRYFDLRVAKTKDGTLKIYHGPFKGVTLDSVFKQITDFLQQNPTEGLILDFQHFDGDAQADTKAMVLSTLPYVTAQGNLMEFVDNLTLGAIRSKCLILWGDDSADNTIFLRRNNDEGTIDESALHSYYESKLNKKSSSAYVKDALPYYIERYKQQGGGLFVLQGQLTDGLFVFGPRFREATHNKNMNQYVTDLQNSADLSVINIIMRDYVSPHKNCLALQLNLVKNNVKESSRSAFQAMIEANLNK